MENNNQENKIKQNLKKQFQGLHHEDEIPDSDNLKNDIFKTLDNIGLMGDIMNLFTVKFSESEATFIDIINPLPKKDPNQE